MNTIAESLQSLKRQITEAEQRFGRPPGSVTLLAVSKVHHASAIREAHSAGQHAFGENHLQEALVKIHELADLDLEWHFIGPIQSNKTRLIAQHFQWAHSIDRLRIARRLSEQRGENLPPLNVCVQVNVSGELSKSGVAPDEVSDLVLAVAELPRLHLRGLMTIPRPSAEFNAQRAPYRTLRSTLERLSASGPPLDTLSMGMTADMEAAIAEGATIVRVGTAIFGARDKI